MYMHGICVTYTWYMRYIYLLHILFSVIFQFCKLSKKQSILDELEIHVRCMESQDNYLITLKRHDLLSDKIYHGYTRYIACIYHTYTMLRSLVSDLILYTNDMLSICQVYTTNSIMV
jgi:hypothetical protein